MIAIHTNSGPFAKEWVSHCQEHKILFKPVDCFASDIVSQLHGCQALFWHWQHHDYHAALFARQLIASVEQMGIVVFPSTATAWHYDDKVGQKYLLEAIGAPLVASHVFYDREIALRWIEGTNFPKVWKLRGGAGSRNVQLVKTQDAARRIVKRSFGSGWSDLRFHALSERLWHARRDKTIGSFFNVGRGVARTLIPHSKTVRRPLQRDYVYFQDFIPGNTSDIRVNVIGERACAMKRLVRTGDFRASASGSSIYDAEQIPLDCIRIAFETSAALRSQSCAFDFVCYNDSWLIVEISYAFTGKIRDCPGYWDNTLQWKAEPVTPERFMLEDVLASLRSKGVGVG